MYALAKGGGAVGSAGLPSLYVFAVLEGLLEV